MILGILTVFIHLASLESFGIPYLMPFVASQADDSTDLQDALIRKPLFSFKLRPIFSNKDERVRYKKK